MEVKTAAVEPINAAWRTHCLRHPERFAAIPGTATVRKQFERWEDQRIIQLANQELPLLDRAIALRNIVELRRCTARDASTFFGVAPQIVVLSLSLLELAADEADATASPPHSSRASKSRRAKVA